MAIPIKTASRVPTLTKMLTKMPASKTPTKLADIASQKFIPKMEAAMPPDHAPVPGNGTATNNMSPSHWNSCIGPAFCLVLSKILFTSHFPLVLLDATNSKSCSKYKNTTGIGSMFLCISASTWNQLMTVLPQKCIILTSFFDHVLCQMVLLENDLMHMKIGAATGMSERRIKPLLKKSAI
jgi:hypothetical protein